MCAVSPQEYTEYLEDVKEQLFTTLASELKSLADVQPNIPPTLILGLLEEMKIEFLNSQYYESEE